MLRKLKGAVLLLYLVIAAGIAAGVLLWLQGAWASERRSIGERLAGEASVVMNFIQGSLIDTSKLLDLARIRILEGGERRPLDPLAVHNILDATLKSVSFSVSEDLRGLLFFIDPNGQMVAQSGRHPAPSFDFSDRLYYRKLIADPTAKVAVGNMLTARTTGQVVFHISMPVRSLKDRLLGILVQQIRIHDVARLVEESLADPETVLEARLASGEPLFVFPLDATPVAFSKSPCQKDGDRGWLTATADRDAEKRLVGYASSRDFGFCASASLPEQIALSRFLRARSGLLFGAAMAFLFTTGLFMAVLDLVRRLDDEIERSNHDVLTGLRNRRFLDSVYESYCRESVRSRRPLAVLFLDIDHFKQINDRYGHAVGDLVLRALGEALRDRVRRPLDVCCRWGGEEFVALLPGADVDGARAVASDIQDHVRRLVIRSGNVALTNVTVSVGIISRTLSAETITDDLVGKADRAMLAAKAQGRDRIVAHDATPAEAFAAAELAAVQV
jgi:diguanylate cyclase (GGDEF)-like protein